MDKRKTGRAIRKRARVELAWIQSHIFPRDTEKRERREAAKTARIYLALKD